MTLTHEKKALLAMGLFLATGVACALILGLIFGLEGENFTMCRRTGVDGCFMIAGTSGYTKVYNISFTSSICSGSMLYSVTKSLTPTCDEQSTKTDLAMYEHFFCVIYQRDPCTNDPVKSSWYMFALVLGCLMGLISMASVVFMFVMYDKKCGRYR